MSGIVKKSLVINLLILAVVIIIFLFLLEGFFRVSGMCKIAPEKTGNLLNFYEKTNDSLIFKFKPNSEGYLIGKYVKINSQGFRDYEYSLNKGNGTYRIAVVGDSITFGWGVSLEDSYPKLIEKALNKSRKIEVLNFGFPGYVSSQELPLIQEKVLDYKPDMIILGHFLGSLDKPWNLFDTKTPIPTPIKIFLNEHSCSYNWLKEKYNNALNKAGIIEKLSYKELYNNSELWKKHLEFFQNLSKISKENNITTIVVLLPNWENLNDSYEFVKEDEMLIKAVNDTGMASLDIFPYLKGINAEDYRIEHVHPNEKGDEKIAEIIVNFINNNKFIR